MAKKAIKETKYCSLISQSIITDEEYTYALEKIIVKPQGNREELRFSVYKDQQRYGMKLLVRPLDLQEELFLQLLKKALEDKLFSKKFIEQLKKLINSINNATEEKGFIIQNLIDEIAPDWDTNFKVEKTNLIYTGTVKSSPTYDSKLKNGILIIDEATKLDTKKWQALAQYAKINNIKIFALGDLKQTGEFKRVEREKNSN